MSLSFFLKSGSSPCSSYSISCGIFVFLVIQSNFPSASRPFFESNFLKSLFKSLIQGLSSKFRLRQQFRYLTNSLGNLKQSSSTVVFLFSFFDSLVLLVLCLCCETLPREFAFEEVKHHVGESFQVVSPRLLVPEVSIQRSIARCSCETFAFLPRNVLTGFGISESLGKSKIYHVDNRCLLIPYQEIVWLYISMQKISRLNMLNSF